MKTATSQSLCVWEDKSKADVNPTVCQWVSGALGKKIKNRRGEKGEAGMLYGMHGCC